MGDCIWLMLWLWWNGYGKMNVVYDCVIVF